MLLQRRTTGVTRARHRRVDRRTRGRPGGIGLDAEQEIRADEQPLERGTNAGIEAAVRTGTLIEAKQRLDVVARRRPAIRTSRQRRQNLCRASVFARLGRLVLVGTGGLAHENSPTARRIHRHMAVVQARQSGATRSRALRSVHRLRGSRSTRAVPALGLDVLGLGDGGKHLPEAGLQRHPHLQLLIRVVCWLCGACRGRRSAA